jgi:hypothetical protein
MLRALVLEDPLGRNPIQADRFPTREPQTRARQVLRVDGTRGARMEEHGAEHRAERRRALQDLGWRVHDALSVLPRRERDAR